MYNMLIREFYGNLFLEVTVGEMIMMMKKNKMILQNRTKSEGKTLKKD